MVLYAFLVSILAVSSLPSAVRGESQTLDRSKVALMEAKVQYCWDGDSCTVTLFTPSGQKALWDLQIRLYGIDCQEKKKDTRLMALQPMGIPAAEKINEIVKQHENTVWIRQSVLGTYKRIVAELLIKTKNADGHIVLKNLNVMMVRLGMCEVYRGNPTVRPWLTEIKYDKEPYFAAAEAADADNLGIWKLIRAGQYLSPYDFRRFVPKFFKNPNTPVPYVTYQNYKDEMKRRRNQR